MQRRKRRMRVADARARYYELPGFGAPPTQKNMALTQSQHDISFRMSSVAEVDFGDAISVLGETFVVVVRGAVGLKLPMSSYTGSLCSHNTRSSRSVVAKCDVA